MIKVDKGKLKMEGTGLTLSLELIKALRALRKNLEKEYSKEFAEEKIEEIYKVASMSEEDYKEYVKRQLDMKELIRLIERNMDEMLDELENDEDFQKRQEDAVMEAETALGMDTVSPLEKILKAVLCLKED